jgi:hypothetical protein
MFFKAFNEIACVETAKMIEDGYLIKLKASDDADACLDGFKRNADVKKLPDGTYQIGPRLFGISCRDQQRNIVVRSYTDLRTATDRSSLLQMATHGEVALAPGAKPIVLNHCDGTMDMKLNLHCSSHGSDIEFTIIQTSLTSAEVTLKQGDETTIFACGGPLP